MYPVRLQQQQQKQQQRRKQEFSARCLIPSYHPALGRTGSRAHVYPAAQHSGLVLHSSSTLRDGKAPRSRCLSLVRTTNRYSRWPYIVRVCVTKIYPHYTGHPHYIKNGLISALSRTIGGPALLTIVLV